MFTDCSNLGNALQSAGTNCLNVATTIEITTIIEIIISIVVVNSIVVATLQSEKTDIKI